MRNAITILIVCAAIGATAWSLASATGRVDADERVSAMLPPPSRQPIWEPGESFQALSFGGQAVIGVAMLGLAWTRLRRRPQ